MRVSASIVLYNTPLFVIERLLNCIRDAKLVDVIYLIDNSSRFLEFPYLSEHKSIEYIWTGKNSGYGAGHNIAIRMATKSDSVFHFVLNPDIFFQPNALHQMIARMRQDSSIGQLMPKVIYPDGSLQYLCKLIPSPFDLFFRGFLPEPLKKLSRKKNEFYELRFTGYDKEMEVPCLSGCFMLFRISALKQIGLFDERFFMYAEDFDITRRMHSKFKTLFFPEATIIHEHAKESYKNKKMLIIHILSVIRYFNKWGWFFDAERKIVNGNVIESLKKKF